MIPYSSRKNSFMKTKSKNFIMIIVMGTLFSIFGTWAAVEFIIYLVKDDPFNWWSLGLTIAAFVGEIYFFITAMSD